MSMKNPKDMRAMPTGPGAPGRFNEATHFKYQILLQVMLVQ